MESTVKSAKTKKKIGIGVYAILKEWMKKKELDFDEDKVKILPDDNDAKVEAYEFLIDHEIAGLEIDKPDLIKKIKVTIYV